MDRDDPKKDINAKSLLRFKGILAPILKGVLAEFRGVSVEEIITTYLSEPDEPGNPEVKALDTERGGFGLLTTRGDGAVKIKTPSKFGYSILSDFEVYTTKNDLARQEKLLIYLLRLFDRQSYKIDELRERETSGFDYDDIYRNLDHPLLVVLDFNPPEGRKNKIVLRSLEGRFYSLATDSERAGEVVGELEPLPSEREAASMAKIITFYLDPEEDGPEDEGDTLRFVRTVFSLRRSMREKLEIYRKATGIVLEEEEMELREIWGTQEYCYNRGSIDTAERDTQNLAKNLMRQSGGKLTQEEALEEARFLLSETEA